MPTPSKTLIDLENKFWQAIVDQDSDTAVDLLTEPALMVSSHGAMKFDHDGYRQMAEKGTMDLMLVRAQRHERGVPQRRRRP